MEVVWFVIILKLNCEMSEIRNRKNFEKSQTKEIKEDKTLIFMIFGFNIISIIF